MKNEFRVGERVIHVRAGGSARQGQIKKFDTSYEKSKAGGWTSIPLAQVDWGYNIKSWHRLDNLKKAASA